MTRRKQPDFSISSPDVGDGGNISQVRGNKSQSSGRVMKIIITNTSGASYGVKLYRFYLIRWGVI